MKTIQGRIVDIRRELNTIEAQVNFLKSQQPDSQNQIDWLIQNMEYVINNIKRLENGQGKSKSYANLARHSRSHLESTIKRLEIWQETGNKPEF